MKMKFCKINVSVSIGNRKSQITDPVELNIDDDVINTNTFDGELSTLLINVEDAVKAIPCVNGNYTKQDIVVALCELYDLVPAPVPEITE